MLSHLRYLRYVLRHKWFVLVDGIRIGAPLPALLVHDWTKFQPCEWFPYVANFYPSGTPRDPERAKRAFSAAWNHHQKANRHHWQYWVLSRDDGTFEALEMPRADRLEMVADWKGAGRAINGRDDTAAWYTRNRDRMNLHPATRAEVELLLGIGEEEAPR